MSNVTFQHAHDHAVVNLHGYLDWDAAFSLVDTLDTMVETYFYNTIEMVVSSPGGDNQALHYCLARLDRLATEGVHLRTRALSLAASAAAVIVSSGDERVVEPGAFLVWHGAQLRADQQADARTTAALASALTAADERMVDRLVSGALATSSAERPPHQAEPSDRRVLEYLARVHRANGGTKVPKKIRKLARAVGTGWWTGRSATPTARRSRTCTGACSSSTPRCRGTSRRRSVSLTGWAPLRSRRRPAPSSRGLSCPSGRRSTRRTEWCRATCLPGTPSSSARPARARPPRASCPSSPRWRRRPGRASAAASSSIRSASSPRSFAGSLPSASTT